LAEASPKLNVLGKRGMKPRGGFRHQMIDDWLVVGLRGEASVDELNESQKEFGDRRDVGVAEHETRLRLDRRGDPCGGRRDRVIDERAQLAAPHLGRVTCAYSPADDREVQRGDHRHGPAVVRGQELFSEDLAMRREVKSRSELGEPAALGRLRGGAVWFDHLREELLSGHRFENKGEEPFADIELAAAHRDALSAKVRVDRWQVVADDPTGQVELARDRLNGRWALLGEEQPRDRRLSAIEWNDRHGGANLNFFRKGDGRGRYRGNSRRTAEKSAERRASDGQCR